MVKLHSFATKLKIPSFTADEHSLAQRQKSDADAVFRSQCFELSHKPLTFNFKILRGMDSDQSIIINLKV
jgi:hypothetical protein